MKTFIENKIYASYHNSPQFLYNLGHYAYRSIPIPIRQGKIFRKWKNFIDKTQWWSKSELEEFRLNKLRRLLTHAVKNVPYYMKLFEKEKIKPSYIDDFDKLYLIPPLTKEIIRKNILKLKAQNFPQKMFKYESTSGTTGNPIFFFQEKGKTNQIELAFQWRYRNTIGIKYSDEYIFMNGNILKKRGEQNKLSWWKYDIPERILSLSSYHLTDIYLERFVKAIKKRPQSILFGYPSSLYFLAVFMNEKNEIFDNIKLTHTGSENLYPYQKNLMEKNFRSKVYDHYGNTEKTVLMHQCEKSNLYHIVPEYGITEILDEDARKCKQEGQKGEVVSTGFLNYAFPFIRYKTGDIVEISNRSCSCGRKSETANSIQGRIQEFFVDNSGRRVSITAAIGTFHGNEFKNVKKLQFFQEEEGQVIIKIVKNRFFKEKDKNLIITTLNHKLSNKIIFKCVYVDEIQKKFNGKYNYIEQKLQIDLN